MEKIKKLIIEVVAWIVVVALLIFIIKILNQ
jgi:hypothetical protein